MNPSPQNETTRQKRSRRLTAIAALMAVFVLLLAQFAYAADTYCPKGRYCTTPGCHSWSDTNGNGICDVAEGPAATESDSATADSAVETPAAEIPVTAADSSVETPVEVADSDVEESAAAAETNSSVDAAAADADAAVEAPAATEDTAGTSETESAGFLTELRETITTSPLIPAYAAFLLAAVMIAKAGLTKKRRNLLRTVSLLSALGILGFYFGGCICPIGGLQNLPLKFAGIAAGNYLAWLLIFLLPIVFVLIGGRIFCSTVCPMGAVQELLFKIGTKLRLNRGRAGLEKARWIRYLKYPVLFWIVIYTGITGYTLFCGNDPFLTLFTLQGSLISWILLALVLLSSLFFSRLWCRAICPYGALLGIISGIASALGGKTTPAGGQLRCRSCSACGLCGKDCPVDAITFVKESNGSQKEEGESASMEIDPFECINCRKCVDR